LDRYTSSRSRLTYHATHRDLHSFPTRRSSDLRTENNRLWAQKPWSCITTRSCSTVTASRPTMSGPGSVAKRARTPTHTSGVLKTVSFTDRVTGGSRVSVCTPDTVALALTYGLPMKRLASSFAKKTSRVTVPPPWVLSRIAPAVT